MAETQTQAAHARLTELSSILEQRLRSSTVTPLELEAALSRDGLDGFCRRVQRALEKSAYPAGIPNEVGVLGYRPDARELLIEQALPRIDVIPALESFKVVRNEIREVPRKIAEIHRLYGALLARIALRSLADAFIVSPPTLVDSVALHGQVSAIDKTTGKPIKPILLSVLVKRSTFDELRLDHPQLDPEL